MTTGIIEFYNADGGYGFIDTDDTDDIEHDSVFFHMEQVGWQQLEEGDTVEIYVEDGPNGPFAARLTPQ